MPAPAEILQLVELFERNHDQYRAPAFTEAAVRHQFIDPFFLALGWDVNNAQGFAEQYKEVVHEDKVKMGGATKAPDYSFRIGKERKFFVEAKKPAVDIQHDVDPAYQLRRYAWSAKLPLSILTDFEQLSVYDCRCKPAATDKASAGRIFLLNYEEYPARWDEIAAVFSKAAVWQGALDKFAEAKAGKRGTAQVDNEFLAEIERWRELLARNLVLRNPTLRGRDINYAVQQIIDRIVFLRICEARGLETFEQMRALLNGGRTYERLQELFRRADLRYNSGLFHFEVERDRAEAPDTLTPSLDIDDKALRDIIEHLYYPQSPYEFSVLPLDILGHVYERFLGKVIRLTPGRQVKIEEKPEVRKAGGVFYTPTYIVDYIVRQTVGPLLEGKTPAQVGGAGSGRGGVPPPVHPTAAGGGTPPLRIADIACGSGSFLLGAYQFLLDWHLIEYLKDPDRWLKGRRPPLERASGTVLRLSIEERKRILMHNLYGVDIDPQAVEVTKLSLLLKVLEGEGMAQQMSLGVERVLPDLGRNIKCGNSLIGPEFYDGKLDLPDEETVGRVNAFDWAREFPEAMAAGGFDAVIGNPPYVLLQSLGTPQVEEFLRQTYRSASYKIDTYQVFLERGAMLTRDGGFFGFIVPNTFLRNKFAISLRQYLLTASEIKDLVLFDFPVFRGASVDTLVLVARRCTSPRSDHAVTCYRSPAPGSLKSMGAIAQGHWSAHENLEFDLPGSDDATTVLLAKLDRMSTRLGTFATAYFGIQTHGRGKYVSATAGGEDWKPVLDGGNIQRYLLIPPRDYVHFVPQAIKSGGKRDVYEQDRLGTRQIGKRPVMTLLPRGWYSLNTIYNIYFTAPVTYSLLYVLGLVSSQLLGWYWEQRFFDQKRTFPKVKKEALLALPIRTINFTDPADVARHDRMVSLVTQMLDLHSRLAAEGVPHEKAALQRRIEMTDRQIDALVYELYGLTEEEIVVVEGTADAFGSG